MRLRTTGYRYTLLPLILLSGFALRLYQLGAQSLWYDETVSAFLASESPARLIAHTARDIHPPLYYLLLHLWSLAAGDSEFALAFFSVFWGTLLIPITYRLARLLADEATGLLAAFLVAISPFNVWYSQEVRMYTMGSF
ncbi:MAG: glycosyltransferase family 39 protein, partial [Anaerolineae bacterium]|nr:glycosyltransferase family 39 protein [Anaerolineae bacterium]